MSREKIFDYFDRKIEGSGRRSGETREEHAAYLEELEKEEGLSELREATSFWNLYEALAKIGSVEDGDKTYHHIQIGKAVELIRVGEMPLDWIPITYGLRDVVSQLLEVDKSSSRKEISYFSRFTDENGSYKNTRVPESQPETLVSNETRSENVEPITQEVAEDLSEVDGEIWQPNPEAPSSVTGNPNEVVPISTDVETSQSAEKQWQIEDIDVDNLSSAELWRMYKMAGLNVGNSFRQQGLEVEHPQQYILSQRAQQVMEKCLESIYHATTIDEDGNQDSQLEQREYAKAKLGLYREVVNGLLEEVSTAEDFIRVFETDLYKSFKTSENGIDSPQFNHLQDAIVSDFLTSQGLAISVSTKSPIVASLDNAYRRITRSMSTFRQVSEKEGVSKDSLTEAIQQLKLHTDEGIQPEGFFAKKLAEEGIFEEINKKISQIVNALIEKASSKAS